MTADVATEAEPAPDLPDQSLPEEREEQDWRGEALEAYIFSCKLMAKILHGAAFLCYIGAAIAIVVDLLTLTDEDIVLNLLILFGIISLAIVQGSRYAK